MPDESLDPVARLNELATVDTRGFTDAQMREHCERVADAMQARARALSAKAIDELSGARVDDSAATTVDED